MPPPHLPRSLPRMSGDEVPRASATAERPRRAERSDLAAPGTYLFALTDGAVEFATRRGRRVINIVPGE